MKKKLDREKRADSITTFIGSDTRLQGQLEFEGTVRLDGAVEGTIAGPKGVLIVGEQAKIKADVVVGTAIIMGEITGAVEASDKIELYPPARVTGDVRAPAIMIESGAVLNGRCEMKSPETAKPKSAAKPPAANPTTAVAGKDV